MLTMISIQRKQRITDCDQHDDIENEGQREKKEEANTLSVQLNCFESPVFDVLFLIQTWSSCLSFVNTNKT